MQEAFPLGVLFAWRNLPIQDVARAILPEAQGHQDHHLLTAPLLSAALALVRLALLALLLDRDPDPIQLHDGRNLGKGLLAHLTHQRFDLIDAFVERAQAHPPVQLGTPCLADRSYALTPSTAEEHVVIPIQPEALLFLQDAELTDPIVLTLLALQHGDLHVLHVPPSRFQRSFVVPLSGELMGIAAPTVATPPVDLVLLAADLAAGSFFPAQFESHFRFQKCGQDGFDGLPGRCFGLLLHGFDDRLAFFPLEMLAQNGYTHTG